MDKQYYWERAEQALHMAREHSRTAATDASNGRMVAFIRLAEVSLKMMEVAPDSE